MSKRATIKNDCAGVSIVGGNVICRGCGIDLGEWPGGEEVGWNPGGYCAFGCVTEMEEEAPTADEIADEDLIARLADPCPECGQYGACAYDAEGRPMIHTTEDDAA